MCITYMHGSKLMKSFNLCGTSIIFYYRWITIKMKICILALLAVIFLNDALEVTDEDINSSLVSYLLAKVQQLEAKMMVRPNIRNTRQTTDKPTKAPVVASNKQCNCPPSLVTYIRWGNSTCPYGADTIYSGVVAGSWYAYEGAAVDPMCLPLDPQYLNYQSGFQGYAGLHRAEYALPNGSPLDHSHDRDVPCALCQVYGYTNKIMIPSHYECPSGWRREYYGYLMAGHHLHKAATQYTCVDKSVEQIPRSGTSTDGYLFYTVEAFCGYRIPCSEKEVTCVVCTK